MKLKLTKTAVDKAEFPKAMRGKRGAKFLLWDTDLTGFGVALFESGNKAYVFDYKDEATSKRRRMQIGDHGVLTTDEARKRAADMSRKVTLGEDPLKKKQDNDKAPTVRELYTAFVEQYANLNQGAATVYNESFYWKNHIFPICGDLKAKQVNSSHVEKIKVKLKDKKTTFNRTRATLSTAFNWAETRKDADGNPDPWRDPNTNPVRGVKRFPSRRRNRKLQGDEFRRFGLAMTEMEEEGGSAWMQAKLRRALHVVPCRLSDLREVVKKPTKKSARWIDWENNKLILIESKTGEREVILPKTAMVILREVLDRSDDENPYLFSGSKKTVPVAASCTSWLVVRAKYDLVDYHTHDARRTLGVTGRSMKAVDRDDMRDAFDHDSADTTDIYLGIEEEVLREKLDNVADEVSKRIKGEVA
jgi:integrase